MAENSLLIEMTAEIVAAFVGNNSVPASDIPSLISQTYAALSGAEAPPVVEPEVKTPAVPVKRSIQPDYIVCLEDGRKFKSLKRHLRTKYNLSPEDYRAKWGLPKDYPMVAPNYAASRSQLAKSIGLGRKAEPEPVKPARGRKAKATS